MEYKKCCQQTTKVLMEMISVDPTTKSEIYFDSCFYSAYSSY